MIPDRVVEVLSEGPFIQIGTRDAELRPAHTIAIGARVEGGDTVTVFVPEKCCERILRDLADNGRVAMGIGLASHEAYQIKGAYLSSRPATDEEHALQEASQVACLESCLASGYPDEIARPLVLGFAMSPAVAITFRAEDVFLQTPGPEAGERMT